MVQGIETDNKYKYIKNDDGKWLTSDLQEIRKTVENYIDNTKSDGKQEINQSVKTFTITRIMTILFSYIWINCSYYWYLFTYNKNKLCNRYSIGNI